MQTVICQYIILILRNFRQDLPVKKPTLIWPFQTVHYCPVQLQLDVAQTIPISVPQLNSIHKIEIA